MTFMIWFLPTYQPCRRYMAEILPLRRKTLYNQLINQHVNLRCLFKPNSVPVYLFIKVPRPSIFAILNSCFISSKMENKLYKLP